ncbi:hypothetical protein AHF37_08907 [Paragonimus kellicotti]|nr:hypothetical protein AHF37_08907 [Paragonimus kellicotti]
MQSNEIPFIHQQQQQQHTRIQRTVIYHNVYVVNIDLISRLDVCRYIVSQFQGNTKGVRNTTLYINYCPRFSSNYTSCIAPVQYETSIKSRCSSNLRDAHKSL